MHRLKHAHTYIYTQHENKGKIRESFRGRRGGSNSNLPGSIKWSHPFREERALPLENHYSYKMKQMCSYAICSILGQWVIKCQRSSHLDTKNNTSVALPLSFNQALPLPLVKTLLSLDASCREHLEDSVILRWHLCSHTTGPFWVHCSKSGLGVTCRIH